MEKIHENMHVLYNGEINENIHALYIGENLYNEKYMKTCTYTMKNTLFYTMENT